MWGSVTIITPESSKAENSETAKAGGGYFSPALAQVVGRKQARQSRLAGKTRVGVVEHNLRALSHLTF